MRGHINSDYSVAQSECGSWTCRKMSKENLQEDYEEVDSSLKDEEFNDPFAPVRIPFSKSWELFWSTEAPPSPPKRKFYFWFPPNQSSYEKKLVFKLDVAIMSYVCLSYFVRYLDQQNISSAYVSGMQGDLNLEGTDYNWLTQLFTIGYCAAGPFTNLLLSKVKVHYLLPGLEIIWGLMCLFVYKAQNFQTVAGLRFIQGACEGAAWPAIHYILGSWYTKDELAKRTSIFTASGIAGTLLSGLIQSGLKANLDGRNGLAGWRWLFIIDAAITFPIAIYGFIIFPDVPNNATPRFYLTEEDISYCRNRVRVNGRERVNKFDWSIIRRLLTSYNWYLFCVAWVVWGFTSLSSSFMSIVLEALGYNVYDRNNIPTIIQGVGIFSAIVSGFVIDIRQKRWEVGVFLSIIWIIGLSIVYHWNVSRAALIVGYALQGVTSAMSPLIVGWCNELTQEDDQVRALTLGSLNAFSGLLGIPWNVKLFNTALAPQYSKGNLGCLILGVVLLFYLLLILLFDRYQNRKRAYIAGKPRPTEEDSVPLEKARKISDVLY